MPAKPKKPRVVYLAEHMADARVKDRELAAAIGVERVTVTRWRNRERKVDLNYVDAIAKALNRPTISLYSLPKKVSIDAMIAHEDQAIQRGAVEVVRSYIDSLKSNRPK